tara:strand:+ start:6095 stop:6697 length:603 start_codon:yes stop_codon:yes gene_type:complete
MTRARPYDRDTALDAALTVFWQKGYHATSLKDLEAALNMKPGSIYAAFSSKESLFLSALERYFRQNREELRSLAEQAETPLKGLADHLRGIGRKHDADPQCRACMLIKTLLDTTASEDMIADTARRYLDQIKAEIAAAFDLAKSRGELPQDADSDRLARRYQSNITALKIEAHRGTDKADLAALAEDMAHEVERLRCPSS